MCWLSLQICKKERDYKPPPFLSVLFSIYSALEKYVHLVHTRELDKHMSEYDFPVG